MRFYFQIQTFQKLIFLAVSPAWTFVRQLEDDNLKTQYEIWYYFSNIYQIVYII